MSLVPHQACLGGVQDVLPSSRCGPSEAFLGFATPLNITGSDTNRGREALSCATALFEQIQELREIVYGCPGGSHNEPPVRV
jgi:hypothetical protein